MSLIPAIPKDIRALETLVRQSGFGDTLSRPELKVQPLVPTGVARTDAQLGGGLPRGAISEIVGPCSSGRTGLVLAAVAHATRTSEVAAYVDATDCLDPRSAERAGAVLERLLWIRCDPHGDGCCPSAARACRGDDAWQAANLVVAAGGFGIVVIDLGGLSERTLAAWQRRPWMRIKHAVEHTPTALVVLSAKCLAGSAADMVLELRRERTEWDGLLDGIAMRAEVRKNKAHGQRDRAGERFA